MSKVADKMTPSERQWLTHTGSLTKRLRRLKPGKVEHLIRYEAWELPQADETRYLGISPTQSVFIRETDWCYQNDVVVTTRALIPAATLQAEGEQLQTIGVRSLGDLLFADPNLKRSAFEFTHTVVDKKLCWARRSIFFYFDKPLLVSEVFFPSILNINPPSDE
jgi:chorismate--pyruvate lyase